MLSIVVLVTAPVLLLFLDKVIGPVYPENVLSASEIDTVLNEDDCTRIHRMIE